MSELLFIFTVIAGIYAVAIIFLLKDKRETLVFFKFQPQDRKSESFTKSIPQKDLSGIFLKVLLSVFPAVIIFCVTRVFSAWTRFLLLLPKIMVVAVVAALIFTPELVNDINTENIIAVLTVIKINFWDLLVLTFLIAVYYSIIGYFTDYQKNSAFNKYDDLLCEAMDIPRGFYRIARVQKKKSEACDDK